MEDEWTPRHGTVASKETIAALASAGLAGDIVGGTAAVGGMLAFVWGLMHPEFNVEALAGGGLAVIGAALAQEGGDRLETLGIRLRGRAVASAIHLWREAVQATGHREETRLAEEIGTVVEFADPKAGVYLVRFQGGDSFATMDGRDFAIMAESIAARGERLTTVELSGETPPTLRIVRRRGGHLHGDTEERPAVLEVAGDRRETRLFMNGYPIRVDVCGEDADCGAGPGARR